MGGCLSLIGSFPSLKADQCLPPFSPPPPLHPSLPSNRDCRALNRIQIAKADASGVLVSPAFKLDTVWDLASFSAPKAGMDSDGSW